MAVSQYARKAGHSEHSGGSSSSQYARKAGQRSSRDFTGPEQAVQSMRRAVEKAGEYRRDIEQLRAQVEKQAGWLYSVEAPADGVWDQRKDIHDDRWQSLEQTIGNLVGWVAIHLAEAGRMSAMERAACETWVRQLYEVEEWIRDQKLHACKQYPNGDPCPF